MLKAAGMAAVAMAVVMYTLPLHTLTACRISLPMCSHRTATTAESVSDLGTITEPGTMAVTAGTMEVMVDTTVDMAATTVEMADTTVAMADITESVHGNQRFVWAGQAWQVHLAKPSRQIVKARR